MIARKTLLIVAAALLGSACSAPQAASDGPAGPGPERPGRQELTPYQLDPPGIEKGYAPMPKSEQPSQIGNARTCGALDALDGLAQAIIAPPAQPALDTERPVGNLIDVANALNAVDRADLSPAMNAAIKAHTVALTNLGALVNHKGSRQDIESMATVAKATGNTVHTLCQE